MLTPSEREQLRAIVADRARVRTHFDGCWRSPDHRDCAIMHLLDDGEQTPEPYPSWSEFLARPEIDRGFSTRVRILNVAHKERAKTPSLTVREFLCLMREKRLRHIGARCVDVTTDAVIGWRAEASLRAASGGGA